MNPCGSSWSRRGFLRTSCAVHLGMMTSATPVDALARWLRPVRSVVAREPWGRLEQIAQGVWALVSTPLQDRTTLCNGGIVAGRAGVLLIEAFASDQGARWMAEQAMALTGRRPTHVVLSHYHGDHTSGLAGMMAAAPATRVLTTDVTRRAVGEGGPAGAGALADAEVLDARRPTEVDLGGRSVVVVPRRGHTDSDVTVEVTDPQVVFCGDLVWNGMFPNYVDATPSRLGLAVRLLRERGADTYVPGHGPLADGVALTRYQELLDDVEAAARRAHASGMSAAEAGAAYSVPASLGEWYLFNPAYFERAIGAWLAELDG